MEKATSSWYPSILYQICYIQLVVFQLCGYALPLYESVPTNSMNAGSQSEIDNCPNGYDTFDVSCYKLNTSAVSRSTAAATCTKDNAHLVDITSQPEQDFVAGLLEDNPEIKRRRLLMNEKYVGAWIGLMASRSSGGELVWSDGESLDFTAWDKQFRRNERHVHCVRMDSRFHFEWGDQACHMHYSFVCETHQDISFATVVSSNAYTKPITAATASSHSDMDSHTHANFAATDKKPAKQPSYSGKPVSKVTTIILSCSVLLSVALLVGLTVFCLRLRKRTHNCSHQQSHVSIGSPEPILGMSDGSRTNNQEEITDVRTSVQSNGYVEFKIDSQSQRITSSSRENHIVHTYFEPQNQDFNRCHGNSTKHTYFVPSNPVVRETMVAHVYAEIKEKEDKRKHLSDPKYAYASVQ